MKQSDDMVTALVSPLDPQSLAVTIAGRLREIRKRAGLTQAELAQLCDTTGTQISRLERTEVQISVAWIEKLCMALNVPAAAFFDTKAIAQHNAQMEFHKKLGALQTRLHDAAAQAGDILKSMERDG
jgi:transcriptional regulator with XRE-family HTH domain